MREMKFAALLMFSALVASGCESRRPDPVPEKPVNRPWEPVKITVSRDGKQIHRVFDGPGGFAVTEAGEYEISAMPSEHGVVIKYSIGSFTRKNGELDRVIRGEPKYAEVETWIIGGRERVEHTALKLSLKEGDWVDIHGFSGRWHD